MGHTNSWNPDLEGLAERFALGVTRDPAVALQQWHADLHTLHSSLRATAHRLADQRLSWPARIALNTVPDGARLLLQWSLERQGRPELPSLPFLSPRLAYAYCASLVHQRAQPAASAALREGRLLVLGLRRDTSTLENKGRGVYDDHLVVLNGWGRRGSVHFFPATTEPSAQYSQRAASAAGGGRVDARYQDVRFKESHGADVDRDGVLDAGRLLAGTYFFTEMPRLFLDDRAFWASQAQTVERDTNGDGRFTLADSHRIDRKGVGRTMYIHQGGPMNRATINTWSAGCQTVPKNLYPTFLSALGRSPRFFYVLIDAR